MPFLQEYTMLDELGRGGFATVYKVRHNELGYIRAVRVLNENIAAKVGEDPQKTPTYQKFLRECKVLLRLGNGNHPNIVHIYQPRQIDGRALVEMDYVDGVDIQHYLKQNQYFVPVEEVIRMAVQMSSALAYCHEDIYRFCMDREADKLKDDPNDGSKVLIDDQTCKRLIEKYKVIHNDIHSGNIMRREDGNFVLLDFGLAINGDEVVRSSRRRNGVPEYKAPEKWDDESILTEQSDIYSFGIVLYQYLAGRVPFPYNSNIGAHKAEYELGEAHQITPPPCIEGIRKDFFEKKYKGEEYEKDYPQWLENVILKCLSKNPKDRFKNGKELYDCVKKHVNEEVKVLEAVNEQLIVLKEKNETLQGEIEQLKQEGNPGTSKWKVFSFALLCALLASVVLLWLLRIEPTTPPKKPSYTAKVDSLQSEIGRLQQDSAQLQQLLLGNNKDERVANLNRQIKELRDENETLKANSEYDGHAAKYWYDNRLYGGHDAKYWYESRLYKEHDAKYWYDNRLYGGHDAKYWYDSRLYKEHDAKYWYDKGLYGGHDAKYWYDNKLYNGHDAKYWYDNGLYKGQDAKYWYDNRLYDGHDAQYWYKQYTNMLKPKQ